MNDEQFKNIFQGRRVLVTGADGFVGSHLTEKLVDLGADVSIYIRGSSDSGTTKYTLKNIPHLEPKLKTIITGNLANNDAITLIKKNNPEFIFHLAADAYVPNSFEHPLEVMESNLIGTLNVLHAVKDIKEIKQVVCTSSSEIYGNAQYIPIDENHPLNPTSPYAASKVAADRYCFSYYNTYGLPVSIIRPFNTFGPRHTYDVIPKLIKLALLNKPLPIYGNGNQSRDFIYVTDIVYAFLVMCSDKKAIGQAINFGTGQHHTINKTAEMIVKLSESSSEIIHIDKRLAEVNCLCCDFKKAKSMFGWEPKFSFEEGLFLNIEWAKQKIDKL